MGCPMAVNEIPTMVSTLIDRAEMQDVNVIMSLHAGPDLFADAVGTTLGASQRQHNGGFRPRGERRSRQCLGDPRLAPEPRYFQFPPEVDAS